LQAHTALDKIEVITPASLQHTIQQSTALTQRLLNGDLTQTTAPDQVYFNLWGPLLITYPASLALPLALLCSALFAALAIGAARQGKTPLRSFANGLLFNGPNLLMGWMVQLALDVGIFFTLTTLSPWIKLGVSTALIALLLGYAGWRQMRKYGWLTFYVSGQVIWAILTLTISLTNPLASPLFTLVLLFSLLPLAAEISQSTSATGRTTARLVALAAILLLAVPAVCILYLVSGMLWVPDMIGSIAWALTLALLLPLLFAATPSNGANALPSITKG
jgi:hypothetical protein